MNVLASLGTPDGFALQFCGVTAGQSTTGNYWIGGYDSNFTSSPMRYISIIKKEYYNVQPYSFNINGVTISGTTAINSGTSIIDSGPSSSPGAPSHRKPRTHRVPGTLRSVGAGPCRHHRDRPHQLGRVQRAHVGHPERRLCDL